MKIVFVSNYYNHHQSALSNALYALTHGDYVFIQTEKMPEERKKLGWGMTQLPKYVKESYLDFNSHNECVKLIDDADLVITGSAPENLLINRVKSGKLLFRYSERLYKSKKQWLRLPVHFIKGVLSHIYSKSSYLLCASAYTAADYGKNCAYIEKAYKWGYFPELKKYDIKRLISSKKHNSLLWVGRFIDWKHPEYAVFVAEYLKERGYSFHLYMIGTGPLVDKIQKLVEEKGVAEYVYLTGAMSPDKVRTYMEESTIFLYTSDFNEGWGVVLNEAMNSGCAAIASHAIGAVPFLIKDKENGLIYKNGNLTDFYEKVEYLLINPNITSIYGENAYFTISQTWNAEVAAERLICLANKILEGEKKPVLYAVGPCSDAEKLKNSWYKS